MPTNIRAHCRTFRFMHRWVWLTGMTCVVMTGVTTGSTPVHAGAPATLPAKTRCDLELNVIDPDPKGLNVRAHAGADGKVAAVLAPVGEWITVHVTAQRGDWMRIDRAVAIDDTVESGEREVFRGDGWVHVRMLGVSELFTGDGTVLRSAPEASAPVLLRLQREDEADTRVLGCSGRFLRVRHGERVGWTDRWCNNERTTCS